MNFPIRATFREIFSKRFLVFSLFLILYIGFFILLTVLPSSFFNVFSKFSNLFVSSNLLRIAMSFFTLFLGLFVVLLIIFAYFYKVLGNYILSSYVFGKKGILELISSIRYKLIPLLIMFIFEFIMRFVRPILLFLSILLLSIPFLIVGIVLFVFLKNLMIISILIGPFMPIYLVVIMYLVILLDLPLLATYIGMSNDKDVTDLIMQSLNYIWNNFKQVTKSIFKYLIFVFILLLPILLVFGGALYFSKHIHYSLLLLLPLIGYAVIVGLINSYGYYRLASHFYVAVESQLNKDVYDSNK